MRNRRSTSFCIAVCNRIVKRAPRDGRKAGLFSHGYGHLMQGVARKAVFSREAFTSLKAI
jgi:hypothetical protein